MKVLWRSRYSETCIVSIPYRFNEREWSHAIACLILRFQFLIGSMKDLGNTKTKCLNKVSIPYRFNERRWR